MAGTLDLAGTLRPVDGDSDKPLSGRAAFDHAVQILADSGQRRDSTAATPMAAEPWERCLARALDIGIVLAVFFVLASLYLYPGAVRPEETPRLAEIPEPELSWVPPPDDTPTIVAQVVFFWAIFAGYELGVPLLAREPLGKRALRLRLGTPAGEPARARPRIARAMAWTPFAAAATLLFGTTPTSLGLALPVLVAVVMLFRDPFHRTWYDRFAGTVVVVHR